MRHASSSLVILCALKSPDRMLTPSPTPFPKRVHSASGSILLLQPTCWSGEACLGIGLQWVFFFFFKFTQLIPAVFVVCLKRAFFYTGDYICRFIVPSYLFPLLFPFSCLPISYLKIFRISHGFIHRVSEGIFWSHSLSLCEVHQVLKYTCTRHCGLWRRHIPSWGSTVPLLPFPVLSASQHLSLVS